MGVNIAGEDLHLTTAVQSGQKHTGKAVACKIPLRLCLPIAPPQYAIRFNLSHATIVTLSFGYLWTLIRRVLDMSFKASMPNIMIDNSSIALRSSRRIVFSSTR